MRIIKGWRGLALLACVLAYAAIMVWGVIPSIFEAPDIYGETLVFESEGPFVDFKEELKTGVVEGDVKLIEYMEVSSVPPIIVDFRIQVPRDYVFPYGETQSRHDGLQLVTIAFILALILLVLPTGLLWEGGRK